jgi:signal peptidase I
LYKKIIKDYEGNKLDITNGTFTINNKPATTYTFKQDYFWMMGDNRGSSSDARFWGFTPEDHIVGKPVFVWLSIDGIEKGLGNISNWKPRWDRMFTVVHGDGMPKSYFRHFMVLLALYLGIDYYLKRKKKKQEEE